MIERDINLEPAQSIPAEITGRGRERFNLQSLDFWKTQLGPFAVGVAVGMTTLFGGHILGENLGEIISSQAIQIDFMKEQVSQQAAKSLIKFTTYAITMLGTAFLAVELSKGAGDLPRRKLSAS